MSYYKLANVYERDVFFSEQGNYTQIDPIGLAGGNPTLYAYVKDPNILFDAFGLAPTNPIDRAYLKEILGASVFCKRKVQRIATKNTEHCHPIFSLFSRQRIG